MFALMFLAIVFGVALIGDIFSIFNRFAWFVFKLVIVSAIVISVVKFAAVILIVALACGVLSWAICKLCK